MQSEKFQSDSKLSYSKFNPQKIVRAGESIKSIVIVIVFGLIVILILSLGFYNTEILNTDRLQVIKSFIILTFLLVNLIVIFKLNAAANFLKGSIEEDYDVQEENVKSTESDTSSEINENLSKTDTVESIVEATKSKEDIVNPMLNTAQKVNIKGESFQEVTTPSSKDNKPFWVVVAAIIILMIVLFAIFSNDKPTYDSNGGTNNYNDNYTDNYCNNGDVNYRAGFESGSMEGGYMIPCENSAGYTLTSDKSCYCEGYRAGQQYSQ